MTATRANCGICQGDCTTPAFCEGFEANEVVVAALREENAELVRLLRAMVSDVRLSKLDWCLASFSLADYRAALVALGLASSGPEGRAEAQRTAGRDGDYNPTPDATTAAGNSLELLEPPTMKTEASPLTTKGEPSSLSVPASVAQHTPGLASTFSVFGDMNRYDLIVSLHSTIQERDALRARRDALATSLRALMDNVAGHWAHNPEVRDLMLADARAALSRSQP